MKKILAIAFTVLVASGCAYNAPVDIAPSYDVYSNYDDKVEGHYALYVDAEEMVKTVKAKGMACSAHNFPVDARAQFETSVLKTFENLVESVEVVDRPLTSEGLKSGGYKAQLVVEVRDLDVDLSVIPGAWTSTIEVDAEITASITAQNFEGKLLGSTIEGDGDAEAESGAFCDGGSKAVGEAMADAMEETMERLGERLVNARKIREQQAATAGA
ncbi:MAG: hypothetical protein ABJN62_16005 [Halioglobus sp.]